jgi:hypothetical protein
VRASAGRSGKMQREHGRRAWTFMWPETSVGPSSSPANSGRWVEADRSHTRLHGSAPSVARSCLVTSNLPHTARHGRRRAVTRAAARHALCCTAHLPRQQSRAPSQPERQRVSGLPRPLAS